MSGEKIAALVAQASPPTPPEDRAAGRNVRRAASQE